jgi:acetyl-CoA carboxylase biotin carboxyl carrier protein
VNLKELKEILEILEDQKITEFELEQEGTKLRIHRGAPAVVGPPPPAAVPVGAPLLSQEAPSALAAPPLSAPPSPGESGLSIVKSPIVGTFYRGPDPNSPPFVSVGDSVKVGQVLCIIEAMKLMNEIEAEVAGEILKVHHESGQPVQFGEPLFTVRPAS